MSALTLAAPMAGWLTDVRDVSDPVFSEEMMGVGVAIDPVAGQVCAPCGATVTLVAPTGHSVTLRTDDGAEILIHVGLETVALGGRGFQVKTRQGDRVEPGQLLITFDLDGVALAAKSLESPIVVTDPDLYRFVPAALGRRVGIGDPIGTIERIGDPTTRDESGTAFASREVVVGFAHGLHARPAARIAEAAKQSSSELTINFAGKSASARSPVAIMALNVGHGDRVDLLARGDDRFAVLDAVGTIIASEDGVVGSAPVRSSAKALAENEIAGLSAVPGMAIGPAHLWRRDAVAIPDQSRGVAEESAALEAAIGSIAQALKAQASQLRGAGREIAAAHSALLDDEALREAAIIEIAGGRNAAQAWMTATASAADALRATANARMKERIADLEDVGRQVAGALVGQDAAPRREVPAGAVVIADDLLPSEILSFAPGSIAAIAIERGGPTSHMAIIAGSLGIPTLVAMGSQLARVTDGQRVLVDAVLGKLVIDPQDEEAARVSAYAASLEREQSGCATRDGRPITLLANLGSLAEVDGAIAGGAEGCGLLRTEFLFLDRQEPPTVEEQAKTYRDIGQALGGRPLTIRTLDIGGDKPVPFLRFDPEENPALGARGVRTVLVNPDLMDAQLEALAKAGIANLKVMLPMVSSVDELRAVRSRFGTLEGGAAIALGVMIETPAAALIADRLAAEADFLSIGTNDLAQYALAMDRTNALLAPYIDALHPAVLRLISMTAEAGKAAGVPVSVCGNLASDPLGALALIGLGITDLSGVPAAFPLVRHAVGQVTFDACREHAARALSLESAAQVRALFSELIDRGAN